ncbi:Alpha-mannosyl-phosphatidylinositol acyltransferase [Bifidobacterium actinocoloniiforme DSM 22766]|uniref:Alpha-mannosyl-phosphatidylinositol acyltransferase n=1 Tax=Bifidobacterium actinocoloniiforme DSM 22766 TaxID=1437605 RepID=A0A086Z0H5_9BIFI|nr:phosphatidylinositol mannoside acyltransferase [Bifidobacterium actinocoloniiforme]AKV55252.1 lauroyl acyltransferase [Bifidobacterium actinocoloniiforme DSM 22766]KFI40025.1 Alpha-mannosyl-phosphatidylinositol acyltransferase [Bifidobacterium actinocoloniiforme DSM 22766]
MISRMLIFLARHAKMLPEGLLRVLANAVADVAWVLRLGGVPQLERNLGHIAGPLPSQRLRKLSRRALRSYFAYFCEALTIGARTSQELLARIRIEGTGYPSCLKDMPVSSLPIAMGHQGNWEYAGYWAGQDVGPVTTVAERLTDHDLLEAFAGIRRGLGIHIYLTGQPGLTQRLTDCLKRPGQVVPLLADRDLSRNGVFVHAFDSIIRVAAGPAVIALDSRLPLYTVNMHRERLSGESRVRAHSPYGYVCQVDGPIAIEPYLRMPRAQAVQALSQAWVDQWALDIRAHPQDWHMMQPIFIEDLNLSRLHGVPDDLLAPMRSHAGDRTVGRGHARS